MQPIQHSVGVRGVNNFHDVLTVQKLLQQKGAPYLKADGRMGPNTRRAIIDFQKHFYKHPDGLVMPGRRTLEYLLLAERPPHPSSKSNANPLLDLSKVLAQAGDTMFPGGRELANEVYNKAQDLYMNLHKQKSFCSRFQTRIGVPRDPNALSPSKNIIAFVKNYESYSSTIYWDKDVSKKPVTVAPLNNKGKFTNYKRVQGYLTVGYGHVIRNEKEFNLYKHGISKVDADQLCYNDQQDKVNAIRNDVKVKITQAEFDPIFATTFNMGIGGPRTRKGLYHSTIIKIINGESSENLKTKWMEYVYSAKKKMAGLGFRRQSELNIFCQNIYKRINKNSVKGGVYPFSAHFWNKDGKLE